MLCHLEHPRPIVCSFLCPCSRLHLGCSPQQQFSSACSEGSSMFFIIASFIPSFLPSARTAVVVGTIIFLLIPWVFIPSLVSLVVAVPIAPPCMSVTVSCFHRSHPCGRPGRPHRGWKSSSKAIRPMSHVEQERSDPLESSHKPATSGHPPSFEEGQKF